MSRKRIVYNMGETPAPGTSQQATHPALRGSDTGVPRSDPFLTLDDTGLALREAAIARTNELRRQANDESDWAAIGRFHGPQVGDLVLELTRASWSRDPKLRSMGFGYLIGVSTGRDETHYVQYGPNPDDVCEWQNCMFIRVPAEALGGLS